MTTQPERWPCSECGGRGARNIGTRGYCVSHLGEMYSRFDPIVFALNGIGFQRGGLRPDHGPVDADLECVACGATWVGVPGDSCWWCRRSHEIVVEWQAELVLRPPDVAENDIRYAAAMSAWGERLGRAVKAGIITEYQARSVLDRSVRRAA